MISLAAINSGIARLFVRICWGLFFALPGEVLNQILSRNDVRAFRSTMISYVVLLLIASATLKGLTSKIHRRHVALTIYFLFFGTLGLMVEWFLLGNGPVLDPFQIIVQPGMFTFWGTLVLGPVLMMESSEFQQIKNKFIRFFVGFSLAYLAVAVLVPRSKGGIFFGFIIFAAGSVALNYFYLKYLQQIRQREVNES